MWFQQLGDVARAVDGSKTLEFCFFFLIYVNHLSFITYDWNYCKSLSSHYRLTPFATKSYIQMIKYEVPIGKS